MRFILPIILIAFLLNPNYSFARTTPEDIVNEKKLVYEQKVKSYSAINQQHLNKLSQDLAQVNKQETGYLESLVFRQGEILDEYVRRNNIKEDGGADGIHRSQDPVSVARIQVTRAHEDIAYQAARVYIFNLTSEGNIKKDAINLISNLEADLNKAKSSAIYSQNLILKLVKNK